MERVKPLTKKQIKEIIELRAGICEIANCLNTEDLKCHHIKRRSLGGTNDLNNILVVCGTHHKMLHYKEGPKK